MTFKTRGVRVIRHGEWGTGKWRDGGARNGKHGIQPVPPYSLIKKNKHEQVTVIRPSHSS